MNKNPISEISADLRDLSLTNLENRVLEDMKNPVKKFGGLNRVRMCGRNKRCFMGEKPKALIFTGAMINIPGTFFNAAIAPVPLWGDLSYLLLALGLFL